MRYSTKPPVGRAGVPRRVLAVRPHQVNHNPTTGAYLAEASTLGLPPGAPPPVLIALITLCGPRLFRLVGADHAGEDVAGWRYQRGAGRLSGQRGAAQSLLLVND